MAKSLIITGARGYIGSALVQRLTREGRALRLVSRTDFATKADASTKIEHVVADLRDDNSWYALLDDADGVVHLASRTDLRAAEADPAGDRELTIEPVQALIRAAQRRGQSIPVVFASTVTIVGDVHANPVNEKTPDHPLSVYDRHKLENETILREATRRGIVSACTLRLSNIYGFGAGARSANSNRGILNEVMRRSALGEGLTIYGRGDYVRDFTHVGDVVDAFCRALAAAPVRDGSHYVIATGKGTTLAQAFAMAAREAERMTGRPVEIRHVAEPPHLHPIERRNFIGDSSLFRTIAGWHPQIDLAAGIRDYLERATAPAQLERN